MGKGIIGKKIGMTQIFVENGKIIPVTVIEAGPCKVSQIRTAEKDGYTALQLAFGEVKEAKLTKPENGHLAKNEIAPHRYLREFNFADIADYQVGQEIKVDLFAEGDKVDVVGTSKGKGFTGMTKKGSRRGPTAHGSKYHRRVGSLGAKGPARVFKGRELPGRMGGVRVTVKNLEVVKVDAERNLILVKGAIPGPNRAVVTVSAAVGRGN